MKFEQITIHEHVYGPEKNIEGVLNFRPEDILCFNTPPKTHWSESTKSVFTYLRLRGSANTKAYLVKYDDLQRILKNYEN